MMTYQRYRPSLFPLAQLVVLDFDRTMADTFVLSPSGIDVPKAYLMAIEQEFGPEMLQKYIRAGGLKDRDPSGVIDVIMPRASAAERQIAAALLVQAKLNILLDEIGPSWPLPTKGFMEFWRTVQQARADGALINTAVISSGHDSFTRRTFAAWGMPKLEEIDIFVTYDMLLALSDAPLQELIKPAPFLLEFARKRWCLLYGLADRVAFQTAKERMIFIGDDMAVDAVMAEKDGIDFTLLDPSDAERSWRVLASKLGLTMRL
jgi:hypothetical protein